MTEQQLQLDYCRLVAATCRRRLERCRGLWERRVISEEALEDAELALAKADLDVKLAELRMAGATS